MESNRHSEFQPGGPLRETAVYVERNGDRLLYDLFVRGEFCHVLASRQVGKTSLVRRVARKLRRERKDLRVVDIDLSTVGNVPEAKWFFTLAYQIAEQLGCEGGLSDFWKAQADKGPAFQWCRFLEKYLPSHLTGKVVIVFDEVGALLSLPFPRDPFFAILRSVGQAYSESFDPFRLSFCMIGIAVPGDLLQDPANSIFTGRGQVIITDFTREELDEFLPPLKVHLGEAAEAFLDAIFHWTNGHPYMTQRLCALAAERGRDASKAPRAQVDLLAEEVFLRDGRIQDAVLSYVDRFVSSTQTKLPHEEMFDLYRTVLLASAAVPSKPGRPAEAYLNIAGLLPMSNGSASPTLRPRNLIFASVFDLRWIHEKERERILGARTLQWLNAPPEEQPAHLLSGSALEHALEWSASRRRELSPDELAFLLASEQREVDAKAQEEDSRHRLEVAKAEIERSEARQAKQRLRQRFVIGFAVGFIILLGGLSLAYSSTQRAREAATQKRIIETFSRNTSQAPEKTLVDAVKLNAEFPEAVAGVRTALTRGLVDAMDLRSVRSLAGHQGRLTSIRTSKDGSRVITGAEDRTARLWWVEAGRSTALEGHRDVVTTVALSDDDELAATGGGKEDSTVRLWNASTGAHVATLSGHTDAVNVVAFSPQPVGDVLLASASEDGTVILWRGRQGGSNVVLRGHTKPINSAEFSRDGRWLATGGEDGAVILWNVAEARVERKLETHLSEGAEIRCPKSFPRTDILRSIAFSPDGSLVAAGGTDGATRLWRTGDGKLIHELRNEEICKDEVWSVAFSHRGDKLVTVGLRKRVIIWSTMTGTVVATLPTGYEGKNTTKAIFSPDDGQVATTCSDGLARLWSASNGALVTVLQRHQHGVIDLDFSRDGRRLVTASWDRTARIWNARDGRPLWELDTPTPPEKLQPLASLAYSPDGELLASSGDDGVVRVWSATAGGAPLEMAGHHGKAVNWIAFSPAAGSPYVASASDDGKAHVYDAKTGKRVGELEHTGGVRKVIFSSDGRLVVTSGNDNLVKIWRREGEGWSRTDLPGHAAGVGAIALSPDQKRLVSGDDEGVAWLWSMPLGSSPIEMKRPERDDTKGLLRTIRSVAFSPDGRSIVTASSDHSVHVWDGVSGSLLRSLDGHSAPVLGAMFLPDGKRIVTGSWDLSARIWDAETGALLVTMNHTGPVTSLAISSDGKTLATTTADGFLWLWDADAPLGDLIAKLPGAAGQVWQAAFSPDGKRIATANEDGRLRIYAATLDGFLSQACGALAPRPSFIHVGDACAKYLPLPGR